MSVIVRGVSKRMGKNDVLRNVSIEVDPGTVVGLQGINGSGKTMLVDKRYAVDSPCGIDPENSVDTVRLELLPELVPCIVRAHGVFDRTAQMVERARLLHSFL